MKEFTLDELADELTSEFGLKLPKKVMRKLVKLHFKTIKEIIKTKSDRLLMRDCEVHSIYHEIDQKELAGKVADVDETRMPKKENNFAVRHSGFKDPKRSHRRWQKKIGIREIPKINA